MLLAAASSSSLLSSSSFRKRVLAAATLALLPTSGRCYLSGYPNMPFTVERDGSGTITVSPKNEGDQNALVIISHGLGDTSEGFADVAEHLAQQMPHVKFLLPTAPTQPVSMNAGLAMPSWYDIKGLDERHNEDCKGIGESRQRLCNLLETEHENTGLPYSRMVLAGFSQGGALSLYTGLQLPKEQKLAGLCVMSAYLPGAKKFKLTPGLEDTPILHCHGTADPLVRYDMATKSKELIESRGATNYVLKSFQGLQHSVNMDELADVSDFLKSIIPKDDTFKIKLKDPGQMSVKELKAAIRKAGLQSKAVGLMEKSEFVQLVRDHRDGKL